ncbi:hypothetical protein NMY22_g2095 [Coprinellus aureogranulatus]|nr:hypothetical protein NMY22_g2095 [Coprinellus aureogranulatus]
MDLVLHSTSKRERSEEVDAKVELGTAGPSRKRPKEDVSKSPGPRPESPDPAIVGDDSGDDSGDDMSDNTSLESKRQKPGSSQSHDLAS